MGLPDLLLIASRPRCGTHLLRTTLHGLPDVVCMGEIFNCEQAEWPTEKRTIEDLWDRSLGAVNWVNHLRAKYPCVTFGFAVHRRQFIQQPSVQAQIKGMQPRVIILWREDMLAQLASFKIAVGNAGYWKSRDDQTEPSGTVTINPGDLSKWVRNQKQSVNKDREIWKGRPIMALSYEQLVGDFPYRSRLAAAFAGGTMMSDLEPGTSRRETRSMRDVVENYDLLKRRFNGTDLSYLFDERDQMEGRIKTI